MDTVAKSGRNQMSRPAGVENQRTDAGRDKINTSYKNWFANTLFEYLIGRISPVLLTCPLYTNGGCGKERRIFIGP